VDVKSGEIFRSSVLGCLKLYFQFMLNFPKERHIFQNAKTVGLLGIS
jgi:hypothetical protein